MTARLSTHVLDTSVGRPAVGVAITVRRVEPGGVPGELLVQTVTNSDGRTDEPLLEGDQLSAGIYEICFSVGDYFAAASPSGSATGVAFLDVVPVRFGTDGTENLHVPLLVTPWAYSTYRGS